MQFINQTKINQYSKGIDLKTLNKNIFIKRRKIMLSMIIFMFSYNFYNKYFSQSMYMIVSIIFFFVLSINKKYIEIIIFNLK